MLLLLCVGLNKPGQDLAGNLPPGLDSPCTHLRGDCKIETACKEAPRTPHWLLTSGLIS